MSTKITSHKRCAVLHGKGRFDGSSARQLEKGFAKITNKRRYQIVFDMSGVTFLSSKGWWALMEAQKLVSKPNTTS